MRKLAVVLALVLLPLAFARAQFCPCANPWTFNDVLRTCAEEQAAGWP